MVYTQSLSSADTIKALESELVLHDGESNLTAHAVTTINEFPENLYAQWKNLENISRWQERITSVTPVSERVSHWVMNVSENETLEWDSEITVDEVNRKIGWRSIRGDIKQAGIVAFDPATGGRGTTVTLVQVFDIPGGKVSNAIEGVVARSPRQTTVENLRHFKQWIEAGEIPTIAGQPAGPRGITGNMKKFALGETNPTPPGSQISADVG